MFKINDYIMYGTTGVCKVSDITKEAIGDFKLKEYYVLTPIYTNNTIIKVPIDNNKIPMRKIMSKEDISNIIKVISNKDSLWVMDERKRGEEFKSILKSGECEELMTLVKSIYECKNNKNKIGTKVSKNDIEIMQMAEKLINEEFATILNISVDEVPSYILNNIQ